MTDLPAFLAEWPEWEHVHDGKACHFPGADADCDRPEHWCISKANLDAALEAWGQREGQREHLAFVAVMNALDVHMPPDGSALLNELQQIAATAGYPWRGQLPPELRIAPPAPSSSE